MRKLVKDMGAEAALSVKAPEMDDKDWKIFSKDKLKKEFKNVSEQAQPYVLNRILRLSKDLEDYFWLINQEWDPSDSIIEEAISKVLSMKFSFKKGLKLYEQYGGNYFSWGARRKVIDYLYEGLIAQAKSFDQVLEILDASSTQEGDATYLKRYDLADRLVNMAKKSEDFKAILQNIYFKAPNCYLLSLEQRIDLVEQLIAVTNQDDQEALISIYQLIHYNFTTRADGETSNPRMQQIIANLQSRILELTPKKFESYSSLWDKIANDGPLSRAVLDFLDNNVVTPADAISICQIHRQDDKILNKVWKCECDDFDTWVDAYKKHSMDDQLQHAVTLKMVKSAKNFNKLLKVMSGLSVHKNCVQMFYRRLFELADTPEQHIKLLETIDVWHLDYGHNGAVGDKVWKKIWTLEFNKSQYKRLFKLTEHNQDRRNKVSKMMSKVYA